MTYQSLVSFEYWTFIAQLLNFFIQMYLFKKFLFKPIQNIVRQRQELADNVMQEAEEAKASALKAQEEYESHLKNARAEASAITAKAIASANLLSDEIVLNAHKEAQATIEKAEKAIELDKQKAMGEARKEISDMAVELASKLVRREISQQDNQALIDQFIDEYGKN